MNGNNQMTQIGEFKVGHAACRSIGKNGFDYEQHVVDLPPGWAEFNKGPHLLVEVPDRIATISVRTSEGQKVTFSFVPYKNGGAPQCVDVQHHGSVTHLGGSKQPVPSQEIRAFGLNKKDIVAHRKDGYGLVCVILQEKEDEP